MGRYSFLILKSFHKLAFGEVGKNGLPCRRTYCWGFTACDLRFSPTEYLFTVLSHLTHDE